MAGKLYDEATQNNDARTVKFIVDTVPDTISQLQNQITQIKDMLVTYAADSDKVTELNGYLTWTKGQLTNLANSI